MMDNADLYPARTMESDVKIANHLRGYAVGGFISALMIAIERADGSNRAKIAAGFPDVIDSFLYADKIGHAAFLAEFDLAWSAGIIKTPTATIRNVTEN